MTIAPTRAAGCRKLDAFVPYAGRDYERSRNTDFGPGRPAAVSRLSPYIRHRLIGEDEVVAAVLAHHGRQAAEKFISEVFWRTYWKGWLEMRPSIWRDYLSERDRALAPIEADTGRAADVEAAMAGQTGIEGFDDWARELAETGYLHNHARMWFASIWIFTLRLPWVLGADFFLRHLMDGDVASNTLSWRWVAGLQTRGKHYLATRENIARYTEGRFAPRGLDEGAPPLEGPAPPPPAPLASSDVVPDLPSAIILHDEDCLGGAFPGLPRACVGSYAILAAPARSPWGLGEKAAAFSEGALSDALAARSGTESVHPCDTDGLDDLAAAILASGATQAVSPYAPVGPAADALDRLATLLGHHGMPLLRPRRIYDSAAWPHATKGFFAFRKAIPGLIDTLGLDRRSMSDD